MINKKQYKFLKRIEKQPLNKDSLSAEEFEIAKYLVGKEMLKSEMTAYKKDSYFSEYCYKITPFGESTLSDFRNHRIKILISILAILIPTTITLLIAILK